ncbi:unnamed protein product [Protopolystoma xenopodis]|uniref:Uncharacterized protein n=1 Tax=Protopolystoma xenopodis TaxID=117903 RepID=A0A448XHW9_9PLAT|nr:unnamed protein product [Protopolystoma xenopodis]
MADDYGLGLDSSATYKFEAERFQSDNAFKCKVMSHHLLLLDREDDHVQKTGVVGQQKAYTTELARNSGRDISVVSTYIHERDGTRLFFNQAEVRETKPVKLNAGFLYFVKKINFPPHQGIVDMLYSNPETE